MDYAKYLKEHQPVVYKIFERALINNKLFHAYLFVGELGTPLIDVASFIAASIIDENASPFVDEDSIIYKRIQNGSYNDFVLLDTSKNDVKIDEIRNLEAQFAKTAVERVGIKVYIINLVENLSVSATNSLLKFLEEPEDNTYAFLLTNNEFRLLPTIRSRVQTIHFSLLNQYELIKDAIALEVPEDDAQLLSFFYNNPETILEKQEDKNYQLLKENVITILSSIKNHSKLMNYVLNTTVKKIKDKQACREFFDYLNVFFKEALKKKHDSNYILSKYDKILTELVSLPNLEDAIFLLMNARNEISYNLNTSLLIVHTLQTIFGD